MPEFRHGIYPSTDFSGTRPVNIAPTSICAIIGTAPDADNNVYPLNTPVLVPGSYKMMGKLDAVGDRKGTLLKAVEAIFSQKPPVLIVIRVAEGIDSAATINNIIGTIQADDTKTGINAMLDAQAVTGYKPRILIAPGFSNEQPVLTKLIAVGEQLRALVFGDCDGTTLSDAIAYRDLFAGNRLEMCWPSLINEQGETVPYSAYRAGVEVQKDQTPGQEYSASASNRVLRGTIGPLFPIDYRDGDNTNTAYLLNAKQITTCINDNGFRTWGNLTCYDDPKWQFTAHVKVNDVILDAIADGIKWARDRKINKTFAEDVVATVNAFLQKEVNAGNLLGGLAWADPELNTPDSIIAGDFYVDYDFTPPGIAQAINVTSHFVNHYAEVIFK